jgi:hypothetical protein
MSEKEPLQAEEAPNKGYSFVVGMIIALAIIVLFAVFFH